MRVFFQFHCAYCISFLRFSIHFTNVMLLFHAVEGEVAQRGIYDYS